MKPRQIKIWPNLSYDSPSTLYFKPLKEKYDEVILDFSNCRIVNSSGLTILLVRLVKLITNSDKKRLWMIELPNNVDVAERMMKLGFFEILDRFIENKDLFWPSELKDTKQGSAKFEGNKLEETLSVPIFSINVEEKKRREEKLSKFKNWLLNKLSENTKDFNLQVNQLVLVLSEIVKNSIDHTDQSSFVGIDFIKKQNDKLKICFSIGDLGQGIMLSIRDYLREIEQDRGKYFGIGEMYLWALEFGNTTQVSSKYNAGIGMSTIVEGAKPLNLTLTIYDGRSCGYLNNIKELTHSKIRKNFYHVGHNVGFYYYGEVTVN